MILRLYTVRYIVLHFIHPCVYFLNNTIEYREMGFCKIRISIVHARYLYINSIRHDWPFPKESQHTMRILRYHMTSSRDLIERSSVQITSASVSFVNYMTYRTLTVTGFFLVLLLNTLYGFHDKLLRSSSKSENKITANSFFYQ